MSGSRQLLGKWGESLAARYLESQGYRIQDRNARTPYGEIDIVALHPEGINQGSEDPYSIAVFVEVKTRSSATFGFPEEAITARKRSHMLAAAESYIQEHPNMGDNWQIDVIAIQCLDSRKKYSLKHFENVIT
jgi:putative endonuclease